MRYLLAFTGMTPRSGMTPQVGGAGSTQTPMRTPIKDSLGINPEDEYEDQQYIQYQQVSCPINFFLF